MTIEERENIARDIFENKCIFILAKKGRDYSGDDDANSNFKRLAKTLDLSVFQICMVYCQKHIDAVQNSIKKNPYAPERHAESIRESIIDIINYMIIIYTLLDEAESITEEDERIMQDLHDKVKFLSNELAGMHELHKQDKANIAEFNKKQNDKIKERKEK